MLFTKTILSAFILFIVVMFPVRSQENPVSLEVRGGINIFNMYSDYEEVSAKASYRFDAVLDRNFTPSFFLRSGLTFGAKNSALSVSNYFVFWNNGAYHSYTQYVDLKARYLQVPVMAGYRYSVKNIRFNAALGGYAGLGISGTRKEPFPINYYYSHTSVQKISPYKQEKTFNSTFHRFDSGLIVSFGAEFKRFTFTSGYESGRVDIRRGKGKAKNRTVFLSLGYRVF